MTEDEGFLQRWSRRKQQADAGQDAAGPVEPGPKDAVPADSEAAADEEAQNRAAAEAVDLDTLDAHSDYTVFLKKGVPAALKTAALRKLWRSDPVLANLDGLNDYDQDFNAVGAAMKEFKSAWEVGRGYAAKLEEIVTDSMRGEDTDAAATVPAAGSAGAAPAGEARSPHGEGEGSAAASAAVSQEEGLQVAASEPAPTAQVPSTGTRLPL